MNEFESMIGRENVYVCPAGHRTWTIHRDHGVTPFMMRCRENSECGEMAQSRCYQEARGAHEPSPRFEWYKPGEKEMKKLDPATKDHVERGGLLIRQREGGADRPPLPPGRRYTGQRFTRTQAEEMQRQAGEMKRPRVEEPMVYVPQRQAKEVAEQLTGRKCKLRSDGKECHLLVRWNATSHTLISAENWWHVLRRLKAILKSKGKNVPHPQSDSAGGLAEQPKALALGDSTPGGSAEKVDESAAPHDPDADPHDAPA